MSDDIKERLRRDRQAIKFIVGYMESNGYAPTVRDIGKAIGFSSSSTAQQIVSRLQRRGWITYKDHAFRTIKVTEDGLSEANDS